MNTQIIIDNPNKQFMSNNYNKNMSKTAQIAEQSGLLNTLLAAATLVDGGNNINVIGNNIINNNLHLTDTSTSEILKNKPNLTQRQIINSLSSKINCFTQNRMDLNTNIHNNNLNLLIHPFSDEMKQIGSPQIIPNSNMSTNVNLSNHINFTNNFNILSKQSISKNYSNHIPTNTSSFSQPPSSSSSPSISTNATSLVNVNNGSAINNNNGTLIQYLQVPMQKHTNGSRVTGMAEMIFANSNGNGNGNGNFNNNTLNNNNRNNNIIISNDRNRNRNTNDNNNNSNFNIVRKLSDPVLMFNNKQLVPIQISPQQISIQQQNVVQQQQLQLQGVQSSRLPNISPLNYQQSAVLSQQSPSKLIIPFEQIKNHNIKSRTTSRLIIIKYNHLIN